VNVSLPDEEWCLIKAAKKPLTYVLIGRDIANRHLETKLRVINNEKYRFTSMNSSSGGGGPMPGEDITKSIKVHKKNERIGFSVYGWNARSAASEVNVYFISAFLPRTNPDFLLINESGKYKERVCKNCPEYGSYHSNDRLTTSYKKSISVTRIMMVTWDSVFMAVKVTLTGKSLILVNIYRPPSDDDATERLVCKILHLDDRYLNTKIVIFGDLNYRRAEVHEAFRKLEERGFQTIHEEGIDTFTRSQLTVNGLQKSYLILTIL
jgi:hypothetical protein